MTSLKNHNVVQYTFAEYFLALNSPNPATTAEFFHFSATE